MLVATIVRDRRDAQIYVRYAATAQVGGDVDVLEVLNESERGDLKERAEGYAETHTHRHQVTLVNAECDHAVIFKKKDGTYEIDFGQGAPAPPADVEIIDVMQRKDGETETAFRERAVRYLYEEVQ